MPPELLSESDRPIALMNYDRSKAIQVAMRNFLTEHTWKPEEEGFAAVTMTIIYDHDVKGLEESPTEAYNSHRNIITSAMHVHPDERSCLLVVAFKSEVKAIQTVAKELMNKRGIKQLKLATVLSQEAEGALC